MVVNVVMLKLKERTDENTAALKRTLLEMKGNIELLSDIKVEVNIRSGAAAFDVIMMTKYDSMQKFNEYLIHPYHMGVGKYVQDVCEQTASVCYEE